MINITGLSAKQKALCDQLWSLNTIEDVLEWISGLDQQHQTDAQSMMELIMLGQIDELRLDDCSEARAVISRIKNLK
jgi:hypothetical protein